MVYTYLPFMILPLYANLERLDPTLDEAAMDLGSRPAQVFRDVTLPQSIPGIIAGGLLVFIPAAGELVIPTLVGDASQPDDRAGDLGRVLLGPRLADGLVGGGGAVGADGRADDDLQPLSGQGRRQGGGPEMNRRPTFLITVLCFGFAFFYIPILSMIVYSFNASRLATVWGGFSTKWYVSLLSNRQVGEALLLSLQIALLSATVATILGTMAGIALARFRRFRGRTLFSGLVTAPLIMPEVITGISSLMFFILMAQWIGWPGRARLHHRDAGAYHLFHGLRHHHRAVAHAAGRPRHRRGGDGPGLAPLAGDVRRDPAGDLSGDPVGLASGLHHLAG